MDEKQRQTMMASVRVAVSRLGGAQAASEKIGCSHVTVYRWINGDSTVAADLAIKLADAANMLRSDFRPDLWGAE